MRFSLGPWVVSPILFAVSAETRAGGGKPDSGSELVYDSPSWRLVWADEFGDTADGLPDPAKWGYEVGMKRNKEAQFYTAGRVENARVGDGRLWLTARKERWADQADYTSASLTTEGRFAFTYGKVEMRARVPGGRGTWPAFWTLGTNVHSDGWPRCGEIDVLEHVGHDLQRVHFTVHTERNNHAAGTQLGASVEHADPHLRMTRYGLVWTRERIAWFIDGREVHSFARPEGAEVAEWPFDAPQYLLLNLAVGGFWGGREGLDPEAFPAIYEVDYVRVWQG